MTGKTLAILLLDSASIALCLLIATVFYPAKNICDSINPLECYGYFCAGFIIIFTLNNAINLALIKKQNERKLWEWKLAILSIPVIVFCLIAIN